MNACDHVGDERSGQTMERSVYLIVVGAGDVDNAAVLLDGDIGMKISRKGTLGALNGDKCAVELNINTRRDLYRLLTYT